MSKQPTLRRWAASIANALLPNVCLCCKTPLPGNTPVGFCQACDATLPKISNGCSQCARPLTTAQLDLICGSCQKSPPAVDLTYCYRPYQADFVGWISAFKYHRQLPIGAAMVRDFIAHQPKDFLPDLLIPVPLHSRRQRQRGFNQSAIIAHQLGKAWQITVRTDVVHRVINTPPLHTQKATERRQIMRRAFALSENVSLAGMAVGLVDDVLTSGATTNALASQLKSAGAESVSLMVLTRAI